MDDRHLTNTIDYLERTTKAHRSTIAFQALCFVDLIGGTEAANQVEDAALSIIEGEDDDWTDDLPAVYFDMVEEATQRGIHERLDSDSLYFARCRAAEREATMAENYLSGFEGAPEF
jgi:hypothetical protein